MEKEILKIETFILNILNDFDKHDKMKVLNEVIKMLKNIKLSYHRD